MGVCNKNLEKEDAFIHFYRCEYPVESKEADYEKSGF